MKAFLRAIVVGYFYCGLALGFVLWASYMWGVQQAVSADLPTAYRLKAAVEVQPKIALDIGARVVAWGPSLAIWVSAPQRDPFSRWLVPGLYVKRLS
jgi:hypothetical protein